MAEYIEREALIKHISANGNPDNLPEGYVATPNDVYVFAIAAVETFPAADVVERKRGEWEFKPPNGWACSACGEWGLMIDNRGICKSNFCPNCGTDMRPEGGADHA